jgi:hypothetical protein
MAARSSVDTNGADTFSVYPLIITNGTPRPASLT